MKVAKATKCCRQIMLGKIGKMKEEKQQIVDVRESKLFIKATQCKQQEKKREKEGAKERKQQLIVVGSKKGNGG